MFRHRGKNRTLQHNLKLASLLSFVAGMVNICGLFAVQRLTTNVTGHFAFFTEELTRKNFSLALIFLFYTISFLLGAFYSNFLVEIAGKFSERYIYTIPFGTEIIILGGIALLDPEVISSNANFITCVLLFAMGLQNSLVTSISDSIVRTTHLTGLFTDLGIELSQLLFYKTKKQQQRLVSSIRLRTFIIVFFFLGGITAGYGYLFMDIKVLLVSVAALLAAMLYDSLSPGFVKFREKLRL